jgi:hypothetical protein
MTRGRIVFSPFSALRQTVVPKDLFWAKLRREQAQRVEKA